MTFFVACTAASDGNVLRSGRAGGSTRRLMSFALFLRQVVSGVTQKQSGRGRRRWQASTQQQLHQLPHQQPPAGLGGRGCSRSGRHGLSLLRHGPVGQQGFAVTGVVKGVVPQLIVIV